jgi:hypothetical protein
MVGAAMQKLLPIPEVPEAERTPLVEALLEVIAALQEKVHLQQEQIQAFRDEIAQLKGQKPRPKIEPSKLREQLEQKQNKDKGEGKRGGSSKRSKTKELEIHETKVIKPDGIPEGSEFKGYQNYTVQGLMIKAHNVVYRLERWKTPQGASVVGKLPCEAGDGHFDNTLITFILYQYYHCLVTQPLILEQLHELGIEISSGQISQIITEGKESYHIEKEEILRVGLEVSKYIHVDDTGARHQGNNGYCTHIGNELFAWFQSTESKSRINFLQLLRAGNKDYVLNEDAVEYMRLQGLGKAQTQLMVGNLGCVFENEHKWQAALDAWGITNQRHIRIATEGVLLGSALEHGLNPELIIMSDDAGQFNVLMHALCWIHAERTLTKLIGFSDKQRADLDNARTQVWDLYQILKAYKQSPSETKKLEIQERFDAIFTQYTSFASLNLALERLYKNKSELLLVLQYPDIPLHNNLSECDIREYVKKRKISGSTRSANGRRCRDTFTSLKKTCRKLGISFWDYLKDRVSGAGNIAPISELILCHA